MPKAAHIQNSFNGGELSDLLLGRQDLEAYARATRLCLNWLPLIQGPVTRRPGTVFLGSTKFGGDKKSRTLPFEFNVEQAYQLEFGNLYVRFYTLHAALTTAAQTIEGITNANPGVVTITGHGYSAGQRLLISDLDGVDALNGVEIIVANTTTDTFELTDIYGNNIDTTNFTVFGTTGTVEKFVEVVTPYTEAQLDEVRVFQLADLLYILHPDHPPATLSRDTATTWTYSEIDFLDGPYDLINATATTLTLSGTTGSVTVTASAVTGINGGSGFLASDVGRLIRWKDPAGNWTWLEITAHTDTLNVTATIRGPDASASTGTVNWRLGLWSDTTGFPGAGTFYEDRFFAGGADLFPQRLDGSRSGLYADMAPSDPDGTVADDHAVKHTLSSGDVNQIFWMADDEKGLLVGTAGSEWVVRPSSLTEAMTPANISAKKTTKHGSAPGAAVKPGKAVLFVQRAKRKLREFAYVFESDGFKAPDMTLLASHISRPAFGELVYQQQPQSIVWIPRTDGVLLGFTYDREQNVTGWHRHQLGGTSDAAGAAAIVESLVTSPHQDGDRDELYMVVQRWINGRKERHIEYMDDVWEQGDILDDALYYDSGYKIVNASPTARVSGLFNHEGEVFGVLADGKRHTDVTVTNGEITLDYTATKVSLGSAYNSDMQLLPIEAGAANGTAQGKKKRIERLGLWLADTLGLKYGRDFSNLTAVADTKWGDTYDTKLPLFTGVKRLRFEDVSNREANIVFRAEAGQPATILAAMPVVNTEDDS